MFDLAFKEKRKELEKVREESKELQETLRKHNLESEDTVIHLVKPARMFLNCSLSLPRLRSRSCLTLLFQAVKKKTVIWLGVYVFLI
jgi:hypothetical protein